MQIDVNNKSDIKSFLKSCSHQPGVYQMLADTKEILYVGKARDLAKRLASYFNLSNQSPKVAALVKQISEINTTVTNTEAEALILECNLIKQYKPKYNILLRDDKTYPYICLSKHPYPRLFLYRGKKTIDSLCFGPYPNIGAARETIKILQQVFLIRTCTDSFFNNRTRPCLLYQLDRCTAPCVDYITNDQYAELIESSKLFLTGKSQELISKFVNLMESSSVMLNYEQAGEFRDKIKKLQAIFAQQHVASTSSKYEKTSTDVIFCNLTHGLFVIVILQFRHGTLLGSKQYTDKFLLDFNNQDILEDLLISALSQHYLNFADESSELNNLTKNKSYEIVININLTHHGKQLLKEIILKHYSQSASGLSLNIEILTGSGIKASKLKWLKLAEKNVNELIEKNTKKSVIYENQFFLLKQELNLDKIPNKIECFDVSHTFGDQTVASCVVYNTKGPDKNNYRKYNIKNSLTNGNDIEAMYQVLMRRYNKILNPDNGSVNSQDMPELILIDGGKAQVNIAKKVFVELNFNLGLAGIKIYGITKGTGRRAVFDRIISADTMESVNLSDKSLAKHLLQQIRDEAHRFAIMGHRALRAKEQTSSKLEDLPGIGAKRRKNLLVHFGGWQQIVHATVEQLATVPGISKKQAQMIYDYLNNKK